MLDGRSAACRSVCAKQVAGKDLVRHIGKIGKAAEVKALVNMVMNINTAGLAEGLGLAKSLGHDLAMICESFSPTGANLLFQFCSALYERVAVILTTNLKFTDWTQILGNQTLTAAQLDRLTHHAHLVEFSGTESYRFKQRARRSVK